MNNLNCVLAKNFKNKKKIVLIIVKYSYCYSIWYTSYNSSMHVRKGKLLKAGCTAFISYGYFFVISPQNFSYTIFYEN